MRLSSAHPLWRHLPLLAGEFVLGTAALAAITLTINEPFYEGFVHLALLAGLVVSAFGVGRQRVFALPGAVTMLTALFFYLARHLLFRLVLVFFPAEVMAHEDLILAALIGWFLVSFSFWQASRTNLIFMVVCGLAIFGLVGTVNLNAELLICFAAFMCAAVFCWGYEQFLILDERLQTHGQARPLQWREFAQGQLSVALLVGLLTFCAGSLLGSCAYRVSPNLYATMSKRVYGWDVNRPGGNLFNSFDSVLRIGSGPVRLEPVPVMQVQADRRAYWRAMVYDYYDGHQWSRTYTWSQALQGAQMEYTVPQHLQPARHVSSLNRQYYMLAAPARTLLFAAAQPVSVGLDPGAAGPGWTTPLQMQPRPQVDSYGCLSVRGDFGVPLRRYSIDSQQVTEDPKLLSTASADYSDPYFARYLQVPTITQAALETQAKAIAAAAATPYDKVAALKEYVQNQCLYSTSAPPVPRKTEAVDWFLNHSRQGACDLFSSSLVVLCRLNGIPARVATGYAPGEYNQQAGVYEVKGTDAHAWPEIYYNGFGWVTCDVEVAARFDEQTLASLLRGGYWQVGLRRVLRLVLVVLILAVLAVIAAAAVIDPLQLLRRVYVRGPQGQLARLSAEYRAFYALLLRRSKLRWDETLTPHEAVAAIVKGLPGNIRLDRRRLQLLNERFYHVRYDLEVTYAEIVRCRQELQALRRQLGRR